MAVTLGKVANKTLSFARSSVIHRVFDIGPHDMVLILGYSCSDYFDISPQIEALDSPKKVIVLIEHTCNAKSSNSATIEALHAKRENNPFRKFTNGWRIYVHTDTFVKDLWQALLREPYHSEEYRDSSWREFIEKWSRSNDRSSKKLISGNLFNRISEYSKAAIEYEASLAALPREDRRECVLLNRLGNVYRRIGNFSDAVDCHQRAIQLAEKFNDRGTEINARIYLAYVYFERSDYLAALRGLKDALEAGGDKNPRTEANIFGALGLIHRCSGDYVKAKEAHERSLDVSRRIGYAESEANQLGNLGLVYKELGEYRKALCYHKCSLKIAKLIGDQLIQGNQLGNMGIVHRRMGNYQEALTYFERALEIQREIKDPIGEANQLLNIGLTHRDRGDINEAARILRDSLRIGERLGNQYVAQQALEALRDINGK